ncbi:hypothetical protein, partial [Salmonella enterica]|uniref:hypothetical protein n=1 Tax=Salmonella enterica TaxID=28901 RepID=UPI0016030146
MKSKKCVGFLSWLLLCAFILTPFFAQAVRSSGAWQELTEQTAAINGTPPQADSVTIPVYQGSVQLRSDAANSVDYSAKPSQFSTSDAGRAMLSLIHISEPTRRWINLVCRLLLEKKDGGIHGNALP